MSGVEGDGGRDNSHRRTSVAWQTSRWVHKTRTTVTVQQKRTLARPHQGSRRRYSTTAPTSRILRISIALSSQYDHCDQQCTALCYEYETTSLNTLPLGASATPTLTALALTRRRSQ